MIKLQMLICIALLLQVTWQHTVAGAVAQLQQQQQQLARNVNREEPATTRGILENVLRGGSKSRQSRCVRCYEDRYYGGAIAGGGVGVGGYSSRTVDERDRGSAWYYPSYDRYDDRAGYSGRERERGGVGGYERYPGNRDDRYTPSRTYDRYEGRGGGGYDEYSRGSTYDRGYGYDTRDRYSGDRYSGDRYGDTYRDRYDRYDRYRGGSAGYDRYERDPYDRYYSRYDFRNYRPWDETYRGQSGFDNSGRGYYFAGEQDDRQYLPLPQYERERGSVRPAASPCGHLVANCPYGSGGGGDGGDGGGRGDDRGTKVSSGAIDSNSGRDGHTSVISHTNDNGKGNRDNGQGSWTYMNEQDKQDNRGSSNGNGNANANGSGAGNNSGSRDRDRDQQSSSYGGRPPRPLGGSYLFDRDSNMVVTSDHGPNESANAVEGATNADAAAAGTEANKSENLLQAQK